MTRTHESTTEIRHRIMAAGGAALLVAGLILVVFILPAEYGVDPLGTGARFGLSELGATGQQIAALEAAAAEGPGRATTLVPQDRPFHEDSVSFMLSPGGWIEYKYRLEEGEALLYSWGATGTVAFEFHAEPDGAPAGYAETYEAARGNQASGTLTAPFSGIHGWYWENPSDEAVTVTLTTAGFYNIAHEFREGEPVINKMFQ